MISEALVTEVARVSCSLHFSQQRPQTSHRKEKIPVLRSGKFDESPDDPYNRLRNDGNSSFLLLSGIILHPKVTEGPTKLSLGSLTDLGEVNDKKRKFEVGELYTEKP